MSGNRFLESLIDFLDHRGVCAAVAFERVDVLLGLAARVHRRARKAPKALDGLGVCAQVLHLLLVLREELASDAVLLGDQRAPNEKVSLAPCGKDTVKVRRLRKAGDGLGDLLADGRPLGGIEAEVCVGVLVCCVKVQLLFSQ